MKSLRYALFGAGLLIAVWMAMHSQVHRDHFFLLTLGWELVEHGRLLPHGPGISGGGLYPGYLASLLSGLPLYLWEDYRAPNFLALLLRVLAYLLLDRALRDHLDERERFLLCVLYWVNPWALYHSAVMWAPNWVFLPGVAHFWTAFRQRKRATFPLTFLHVMAIGAAFQFQGSFLILAVVSVLLLLRGYLKVHWGGVVAAATVLLASFVPWMLAVSRNPDFLPGHEGFLGRGLVLVHPIWRGVVYFLRFPSMWYSKVVMTNFDFGPTLGETADSILAPTMFVVTKVIGPLTLVLTMIAFWWLWKQRPPALLGRIGPDAPAREWLVGAVRWTLIGAVITFALSPQTIMSWQVFIVMHVSVLPTVFWLADRWRSGSPRWIGRAIAVHAIALVLIAAAMAVGSHPYRKGGRQAMTLSVREMYPMLVRLQVDRHCTVVIDPENGHTMSSEDHALEPANFDSPPPDPAP